MLSICCRNGGIGERGGPPVFNWSNRPTLDYKKIQDAIPSLFQNLTGDGWIDVARAIITTDTTAKISAREVEIDEKSEDNRGC